MPTVEILSTGDELLTGQVVDTNSTWLMDRLWDLGLMVRRKTLVGDDRGDLQAALREATARADVVVMSGGMGPTEDDLTAECVAAVLGVPLERHEPSLEAIRRRFQHFGRPMTPNNEKQALFPRGAAVIPNRFGTAPGFSVQLGRARLYCLPGVPVEYKGLCDEAVLPALAAGLESVPAGRVVKLFGLGESAVDHAMRPLMDAPENQGVRFGYRAHWPEVHVKWTVGGEDATARADRLLGEVRALFGDAVWGEGKDELPRVVVERLLSRGERVTTAESCTGGLVAELLTSVPGSSGAFDMGVVAYSYEAKSALVGVPAELIAAHGAVSEPVARALAEGSRARAGATWGVGITGIAGPGGGTPEKPVGTVHLALAGPGGTAHVARLYRGDRDRVRRSTAFEALFLLLRAMR
ncbi:competence/damage-inducible protein A [Anaeromyxobacter paludicola]|uniref:competence/damage-inducible protein A n=1 Tax=Anaeromyxobacter paludicola TaxID=2918171 RepID=UPI0020C1292D|nr:competence/damage-inducible protein A [Anaeromyxobacter paludicola]